MDRIFEYHITIECAEIPIQDFLRQKGYSHKNLVALKKMEQSILVNGKWEYLHTILHSGDDLKICATEPEREKQDILPVNLPFLVVYEDEDIVVVNKPAGMPIHPSINHYDNTLANAAKYYYRNYSEKFVYRCINRLDRDTSGLTILGKNYISSSILYQDMLARRIRREYLAIVEGTDLPKEGVIELPIARKEGSVIEREVNQINGERAITHFKVETKLQDFSVVRLHLDTGRTHQIRVHMSAIGHPLLGDFLYNPNNTDMKRQALHSCQISFPHPITRETIILQAELPKDMQKIMKEHALLN